MRLSRWQQLFLGLALTAYVITLRLLPHPDNFAPLTAVAIFGGAYLPRRQAVAVTLGAAVLSDALIGFYTAGIMLVVWASYALITLASHRWLQRPTLVRGGLLTVAGSCFFFVTTNFAVWAAGNFYPHNLAGLGRCYALALPFFRNSLLGDLFYTAALFGAAALITGLAREFVRHSGQHA